MLERFDLPLNLLQLLAINSEYTDNNTVGTRTNT